MGLVLNFSPINANLGTKSSVIIKRRSCKLRALNSIGRGNTLKRSIYFIIIAMSFTLVFSQGKPCCKNKSGKNKVSCKFNQAKIDAKNNGVEGSLVTGNAIIQCPNKPGCTGCKCSKNVTTNSTNQKCDSCENAKWWKFWAKKKNCCSTKS